MNESRWLKGTVVARRPWNGPVFSLLVDAAPLQFEAGQFVKLGLPALAGEPGDEGILGRPYSFVNAPAERPLEFLCIEVPGGPLSPRLARLAPGDPVHVARQPSGFLVLSELPDAPSLWLICTGTGIGPFLSILKTQAPWQRYGQVVLVQGTRLLQERTHLELIEGLRMAHPRQFRSLSLVTREPVDESPTLLSGRIPQAIVDGRLEQAAGVALAPATAQVMLCGNPAMIAEVSETLKARGMRRHRRRTPGQISVETYW